MQHYRDLDVALAGVSRRTLRATLRGAEYDGLVSEYIDTFGDGRASLYRLTPLGESLGWLLTAMAVWADENWPPDRAGPPTAPVVI
jgi:DNA-binding HxlR family transcriptional regulator